MSICPSFRYCSSFSIYLVSEEPSVVHDSSSFNLEDIHLPSPSIEHLSEEFIAYNLVHLESRIKEIVGEDVEYNLTYNFKTSSNSVENSRFLPKMGCGSWANDNKIEDFDHSKSVIISFTSNSKDTIDKCQYELLTSLLFNQETQQSILISYQRQPATLSFYDLDLSPFQWVKNFKTHQLLFSPISNIGRLSRQVHTKFLFEQGYSIHSKTVVMEDLISLLIYAGSFHLGLYQYFYDFTDLILLMPSSFLFENEQETLFFCTKNENFTTTSIDTFFSRAVSKVPIFSKELNIKLLDFFITINCPSAKAKLVDLLFRSGSVLKYSPSSSPHSPPKLVLYCDSFELLEETSKYIYTLICRSTNQLEIISSGNTLKTYNSNDNNNNSMSSFPFLPTLNLTERPLFLFAHRSNRTKLGTESVNFGLDEKSNLVWSYLISITGTKERIIKQISSLVDEHSWNGCLFYTLDTTDGEKRQGIYSSHTGPSPFINSHAFTYTFKIGTLSVDNEFISGKKDGKLLKISKATGCQLYLDYREDCWRSDVRIIVDDLSLLFEAVSLFKGELPSSLSFYIPDHHHKRIIGHGGKHIQKWMKLFGVYVKFSNQLQNYFGGIGCAAIATTSRQKCIGDQQMVMNGFPFQKVRNNVLIRTPSKNAHALEQMKTAILELAAELDTTLSIFVTPTAQPYTSLSLPLLSLVPIVQIGQHSNKISSLYYNIGFCIHLKEKIIPHIISSNGLESSSTAVSHSTALIDEFSFLSFLEQGIESLFDDSMVHSGSCTIAQKGISSITIPVSLSTTAPQLPVLLGPSVAHPVVSNQVISCPFPNSTVTLTPSVHSSPSLPSLGISKDVTPIVDSSNDDPYWGDSYFSFSRSTISLGSI